MNEHAASAQAASPSEAAANVRALVGVLASVAATGIAWGTLMPLIPVLLERQGTSATLIGVISSVPTLAVLAVAPLIGWITRSLDVAMAMLIAVVLMVVCLVAMPFFPSAESWFVLRFLIGLGGGFQWIVSEAWINTATSASRRGLMLGIYGMLFMLGFVIGPGILTLVDLDGPMPFLLIAGAIALSGLAVLAVKSSLPPLADGKAHGQWSAFSLLPIIFVAILAAGTVDAAIWGLLAIYGIQHGMEEKAALIFVLVFNAGAVLSQIPAGLLADRLPKRGLLIGCMAVFMAGCLLLPPLLGSDLLVMPLLFVWGAAGAAVYTVGLAVLGERFAGTMLAGANALYVSMYSFGHLIGPVYGGMAMDYLGPDGLPWSGAAVLALFLVFAVATPSGRRR
jgi:MFS family permease